MDRGQTRKGSKGDKDSLGGKSANTGKIFIGGLSWETTTEKLTRHFKRYGEIIDSVVMRDRSTRQPRGFGFVTYADPSVVDKVMKDTHLIDGRTVEIKRSVPRDSMVKGPRTKKIFVGGLLPSVTEAEFKRYFSQFGNVVENQIMLEHSTGRSRGFGFITFDDEQVVDDLLSEGRSFELGGKQVEIKKAEPKKSSQEAEHWYDSPVRGAYGTGESYGYGESSYANFDEGFGRAGYRASSYGMRGGYGDVSYGGGYLGGYGSSSLTDYGSSSAGYGGYGSSGGYGGYGSSVGYGGYGSMHYSDSDSYRGRYGAYDTGYGGSGYSFTGSHGGTGGGYGPSSSYSGYGRSSGRYHPYNRN